MRVEIRLFLVFFMAVSIDAQFPPNFRNNLADYPGHALDYGHRVRSRNNNGDLSLNSNAVAAELAERQRILFERGSRRTGGRGAPDFKNHESKYPGGGLDFVG